VNSFTILACESGALTKRERNREAYKQALREALSLSLKRLPFLITKQKEFIKMKLQCFNNTREMQIK